MEQIISRADLAADDHRLPSSPEPTDLIQVQEFDFVHHEELPDAQFTPEDDANEFAFQLFAPAAGKDAQSTGIAKIRLDSPDLKDAEPGLMNPYRDSRYYFTGILTAEEQQNFEAAAMSGQDIISQSKTAWPGMAYPWKVLRVPATKKQRRMLEPSDALFAELVGRNVASKRSPPGKKARIALRIRLATEKMKREELQTKEAREREKRTRRNREKQLKKRLREKAKKGEGEGVGADDAEKKGELDEAESQSDD